MPADGQSAPLVATTTRAPAVSSADVREFMGRPPHWLLRSGMMLLAAVLALLLVVSWFIKYPDTISGRIVIAGDHPVVEVVARQSGHLETLRAHEGDAVKKGSILAIIESPAKSDAVLALGEKLGALSRTSAIDAPADSRAGLRESSAAFLAEYNQLKSRPDRAERALELAARLARLARDSAEAAALSIDFQPIEGLGKLQDTYADFLNAYNQLRNRLADDYAEKAGALLREQLEGKRAQIDSLTRQGATDRRELELAREKYQRSKLLRESGLMSAAQLADEEAALLARVRADAAAQRALTDAGIEAARVEKELRELEHERAESLRTARETLRAHFNKLRGEIDLWEADYVLRAPADGTLAFYDFWSDRQFVTAGRQVFLIVPEAVRLIGRVPVSHGGVGKIEPGQTVLVRLDDFPYKEFGLVTGKVQSISMVARAGANLVLVELPHPLVTTFKKQIAFKQEMAGEARIITEDLRFIERVLYEIRRAFVSNG
jgi:HlyD family secretion protein